MKQTAKLYTGRRKCQKNDKLEIRDNLCSSLGVLTFCKAFPFHVLFDYNLELIQVGSALLRAMNPDRSLKIASTAITGERHCSSGINFTTMFKVIAPKSAGDRNIKAESIIANVHQMFYIETRDQVSDVWTWNVSYIGIV